ncbi:MAG: heparan-alpha-glucosaminide N-acetyltransferase domain-containing protein [bacterium]|nr:heparan-alpha-glucosaminide N-acetyltransferase domain-containing protein [bacterium]
MTTTNDRILGYDFARGIAIIGMIIVNFKTVMVAESESLLYQALNLLSGKAAALFVTLAGVGMTLMYSSAQRKKDTGRVKKIRLDLLKRALFLFVTGLSYYFIWPADILHYYGVYMTIGVLLLAASTRLLQGISLLIVLSYMLLLVVFDYEAGWNWSTLEYEGFLTPSGFFRHLFFNGFHPVFPWVAFLLTGIWVGRINLRDQKKRTRLAIRSLLTFIVFTSLSAFLKSQTSHFPAPEAEALNSLLGTGPMPPTLFYMFSAGGLSVFLIIVSVQVCFSFPEPRWIGYLVSTGQLALSNYFFHVVIGMVAIELLFGRLEQAFSVEFAFGYALAFSVLLVWFSHRWRKKYKRGPLEALMRRVTG